MKAESESKIRGLMFSLFDRLFGKVSQLPIVRENEPPPYFDAGSYLLCNPDVLAALGSSPSNAWEHWKAHGIQEGRPGSGVSPYRNRRLTKEIGTNKTPNVTFFGPTSALSGLGTAARGYARALERTGYDIEVIDSAACLYPSKNGTIATPSRKSDVVVIHHNPDALPGFFKLADQSVIDDCYVICIWVWELAAFNVKWIEHFAAVDEIWSPSCFSAEAIRAIAPTSVPVFRVPHVVETPSLSKNLWRSKLHIREDQLVFVCTFDASSGFERKNPEAVLLAFDRAFADDERVALVIKFHSSTDSLDAGTLLANQKRPNVTILDGLLTSKESIDLLAMADCVVSAHRSEGFGLNIAEAMSLGKPVIATAYSGNVDFCTPDISYPVAHRLTEVSPAGLPYPLGYVWAEPDIDDLANQMRHVAANRSVAKAKSERAQTTINANYSIDTISQVIRQRLDATFSQPADHARRTAAFEERLLYTWRHPESFQRCADRRGQPCEKKRVTISVIVPVFNIDPDLLTACIDSVRAQSYPYWELCLCDDFSTRTETRLCLERMQGVDQRIRVKFLPGNMGIAGCSNAAAEMATGEFVACLDNDDVIAPIALEEFAKAIERHPRVGALYCDENKIDFEGRFVDDYYKPDWSPEHLESAMYVLHMLVVRKSLFLELGGFRSEYTGAQDYDLALRLSLSRAQIVHVPKILYHWRMIEGSASAQVDAKPTALLNAKLALTDYAEKAYGDDAYVEDGRLVGLFRVRRGKRSSPPVTLVIPSDNATRDVPRRGTINFPTHLLSSIAQNTDYPGYKVLVASNGDLAESARRLLEANNWREVSYKLPGSRFNFSHKINFAVSHAETELLVLLNDDMEVINSGWLRALVDYIENDEIGAVGARLLYPDQKIQHVGMVLGVNETTAHVYHGSPAETVGYNGFPNLIRNYSAVTGACMATRRSVFNEVGGFDLRFAIDFNDTDYCLKLREKGYRIVYTPFCEMYHFESQTVARVQQNAYERAMFMARWADAIASDPYFNPNFDRGSIEFAAR